MYQRGSGELPALGRGHIATAKNGTDGRHKATRSRVRIDPARRPQRSKIKCSKLTSARRQNTPKTIPGQKRSIFTLVRRPIYSIPHHQNRRKYLATTSFTAIRADSPNLYGAISSFPSINCFSRASL